MRETFYIAVREFLQAVRTKGFVLSAVVLPVTLLALYNFGIMPFSRPGGGMSSWSQTHALTQQYGDVSDSSEGAPAASQPGDRREQVRQRQQAIDDARQEALADSSPQTIAPYAGVGLFVFMMYMAVMVSAGWMLTSVVEDKNSRIMEVLLSSVTPTQLMAGKIMGLAAAGLTLVGAWAVAILVGLIGSGFQPVLRVDVLVCAGVYFVLGYLFYSSILAAGGSACSSLKEAQVVMLPVTLMMMAPMMTMPFLARHPNSFLMQVLSIFPLSSPMVMVPRLLLTDSVTAWEILLSLGLLLGSVALTIWAAARIFRVGVLMYGKRPSLGEILRWIGHP